MSNKRLDYVKESVVRKILNDNDWLLMLGERSNGKSYCVKSLILKDCYKDDAEFIYLRRYDIDVKDSQCVYYFGDCPVEAITDGEYSCIDVYRKAIYFANVDQDTGKIIRGKKIAKPSVQVNTIKVSLFQRLSIFFLRNILPKMVGICIKNRTSSRITVQQYLDTGKDILL